MPLPICKSCGAEDFRTSHFRGSDLGQLFMLRYPIRCKVCKERDFVFIGQALSFRRKKRKKTQAITQNGHA
jgi:hypothetical protein